LSINKFRKIDKNRKKGITFVYKIMNLNLLNNKKIKPKTRNAKIIAKKKYIL